MKTARLINAAIWAAIGIALTTYVCIEWHRQGCGWNSLWAAIAFYGGFCLCSTVVVGEHIKEHYQKSKMK